MKDVLVSFSSRGREDYNHKLLRLIDCTKLHWHGDILVYSPDHWLEEYNGVTIHKGWPPDSMTHEEMPYQFKFALIWHARKLGYDRVVWLDTSITPVKDLRPLFGPTGITVFHNLGHPLKNYIADHAIQQLGVKEETLENMEQIWGGALMFDFTKPHARIMFQHIHTHSRSGAFRNGGSSRPGFVAHRHDQAVMSVMLHNQCDLLPYGKIKSVAHLRSGEYGDDCYLVYS